MNEDQNKMKIESLGFIRVHLRPSAAILFLCLAGCANPLSDDYYTRLRVPAERLRTIETLDLNSVSKPEPDKDHPPAAPPAPATLDLSIEEARAIALKHNLDIEASLLDPTISKQDITEEEARFEALLFGDVTYTKTDQPSASLLSSSQSTNTAADAGVRLPLTTGGTLEAKVPIDEFKTNNGFATLNPAYTADYQFSISQPLLPGPGPKANTHAIRVAKYNTRITEASTKLQIMSVIADI